MMMAVSRVKNQTLYRCVGLAIALMVAMPSHARADCAVPPGVAGELVWSSAASAPSYCNGTDWVTFPKEQNPLSWASASLSTTLNNPAPATGDIFGVAVSASDEFIVIGAHQDDPGGVTNAGSAYVLNASTGALVSTLNSPTPAAEDWFGNAVSISGGKVAVAAYKADPGGISVAGSAFVYDAQTGALLQTFHNPEPAVDDGYGNSLSLFSGLLAVGTPYDHAGAYFGDGTVYVFDVESGAQITKISNPTPDNADYFGVFVSGSGDRLAIGAHQDDPGGVTNAGSVYIYNPRTGALLQTISNPDPVANDLFGISVSLHKNILVVGAPYKSAGGISGAGVAYVFNAQTGALLAQLNNPNPATNDNFGYSVSVHGAHVLVGAYQDTSGAVPGAGAAYIFDAYTGNLLATLENPAPTNGDGFGISVSMTRTKAVIGAYQDSPGGLTGAGIAYVFQSGAPVGPCASPAGQAGDLLYSSSLNVLQYCDGTAWYAAGPYGDGGAGCADPVGGAGSLVYNSTYNVLQYCEGDRWVAIGP